MADESRTLYKAPYAPDSFEPLFNWIEEGAKETKARERMGLEQKFNLERMGKENELRKELELFKNTLSQEKAAATFKAFQGPAMEMAGEGIEMPELVEKLPHPAEPGGFTYRPRDVPAGADVSSVLDLVKTRVTEGLRQQGEAKQEQARAARELMLKREMQATPEQALEIFDHYKPRVDRN